MWWEELRVLSLVMWLVLETVRLLVRLMAIPLALKRVLEMVLVMERKKVKVWARWMVHEMAMW